MNPSAASIATIFHETRTIAVVGLSVKQDRPSYGVAAYLQRHGYRIIPVNPAYAGQHILGEHCYPTLTMAAHALLETGVKIDMVDCFRKSAMIEPLADEAIAIGAHCLWLQIGVINEAAAAKARAAGLKVVMDRCTKIDHANLV